MGLSMVFNFSITGIFKLSFFNHPLPNQTSHLPTRRPETKKKVLEKAVSFFGDNLLSSNSPACPVLSSEHVLCGGWSQQSLFKNVSRVFFTKNQLYHHFTSTV